MRKIKEIFVLPLLVIGLLFLFTNSCDKNSDNPTPEKEQIFNPYVKYGSVTDVDGIVYKTIIIGTQTWMAENLKVTKLNDGTDIPLVTGDATWSNNDVPMYCYYNNSTDNKKVYGLLYNWYAVNTGKLCPEGWHLPTDEDWTTLEIYLQNNGYNYDGKEDNDTDRLTNNKTAKSLASMAKWPLSQYQGSVGNTDYSTKRNETGFSALPAGYRDVDATYRDCLYAAYFWTSSNNTDISAWIRYLAFDYANMYRIDQLKNAGFSVRCIKD